MDKHQISSNYQKLEIPNKILLVIGNWCFEFVWNLEFGIRQFNNEVQHLG